MGIGQFTRVAGDGGEQVRVAVDEVGGEELGDQQRFAEPWWAGDDQARELAIGDRLEQSDQHPRPAVEGVAGIGQGDELLQRKRAIAIGERVGVAVGQHPGISPGVRVVGAMEQAAINRAPSPGEQRQRHGRSEYGLAGARNIPAISAITRWAPTAAENCSASAARRAQSIRA